MGKEVTFRAEELAFGYGKHPLFSGLSFQVKEGNFYGVLGKNGSGKSTLLRLIAGLIRPWRGELFLYNQPLHAYARKALGRIIALLPQENHLPFHFTVEQVLRMGRFPHRQGLFPAFTKRDHQVLDEVAQFLQLEDLMERSILTLSGGQRQRVMVGRVLMQEPRLILLDEPLNHLDLHYQVELLTLLDRWRREKGAAILGVLHDLNLTSLYCDHVLFLDITGGYLIGETEEMMRKERLESLFGISLTSVKHPVGGKAQFLLIPPNRE